MSAIGACRTGSRDERERRCVGFPRVPEVDTIARYVERMLGERAADPAILSEHPGGA